MLLPFDWLAADPATFDWPTPRHGELEDRAAAIANSRLALPLEWWQVIELTTAQELNRRLLPLDKAIAPRGLHVPAAAIAPAAVGIPIDTAVIKALEDGGVWLGPVAAPVSGSAGA